MPGLGFANPEHRAKHGNLKGRPKGPATFSALVQQAKKLAEDELPAIVAKMVEMAKAGDMVAASFLVSRFIPLPKPTDHKVEFPLPENVRPGDLDALTLGIVRAVSESRLDPTSGAKLCSAITGHPHMTSTREVQSLKDEVARLRALFQGKPETINAAAANDPVEAWPMEDGHPTPKPTPHEPNGGDDG
jgi:hypothetical protein